MKILFYISMLLTLTMVSSCRPPGFEIGGGGSVHIPPDKIIAGEPTVLKLELSVWGEGSGKMSKRYTQVKCHYWIVGEANETTIPMTIESQQKNRIFYICTIPPQTKKGSKLQYYFDMMFDGHYNKDLEPAIPIVASDSNSPADSN